ncbi:MAG: hypothetical protein ACXABN_04885 [Candidatus Thorarchaeota archaeon]
MKVKRNLSLFLVMASLILSFGALGIQNVAPSSTTSGPELVDLGDGQYIEVGPYEVLESFSLSEVPTTLEGEGSSLVVSEYGQRTDNHDDLELVYYDTNTTTTQTVSVPLGPLWEGTDMSLDITDLQENRTYLTNPGFDSTADWTLGTDDVGSFTNPMSSTITGGYVSFQMDGVLSSGYYRHNEGDRQYAEQTINTNRGEVTWVGVSLDYWVDDAWGGLPIGFWELYAQVGSADNVSNHLWHMQFSDVLAQVTWYSTGLIEADPSLITSDNFVLQIGSRTTRTFGSNPQLYPEVRMDNVRIFIKTRVQPTQVNLEMNGIPVANGATWSLGTVQESATIPWSGSAVNATFSWTPTPVNPDPNEEIRVTFSVDMTAFARKVGQSSLFEADIQSVGTRYTVSNASQVDWLTYYYIAVPNGYSDYFYFNASKSDTLVIDTVSEPRFPGVNFPYWSTTSTSLNISVYDGVVGTYQNGFWKITGHSANIIQDLRMSSGAGWVPTNTYRANDNVRFRAYLDTIYNGATVTFKVYDTLGDMWTSLDAVVSGGIAETSDVNLDAFTAEVGQWTVQAFANDSILGSPVENIGAYSRIFSIEHGSEMNIVYPRESVVTWERNLTYGQDMLLQIRVNDSDNGLLLPEGSATYNWTTGTHALNDMGTGEYSVVLNTADLGVPGRYVIGITWNKQYYDPLQDYFVINVVEETTLQSSSAPGVQVPRGDNAILELFYADSEGSGISNAALSCNWTDSPYSIDPVIGEPGNYTLTITTGVSNLGTYAVVVTAQQDFYTDAQVLLFVGVRQIFTSVSVSKSQLALPVGYEQTITLTYWDTDHDLPISGAESSISCNWSDYIVVMGSPGEYDVTFYSQETDPIQDYTVVFNVNRFAYQNHTFNIGVSVITHLTSFSLDNPIEPTPYTGQITIYVLYYDITTSSGIVGTDVLIYAEATGVPSLQFSVVNGSISGQYIISVTADQWGSIGWKDLTIYANWTGPQPKHDNKVLSVSARISGSPTDLYIGSNPIATPYGENITFSVIYWDVSNSTGITNATGIYPLNVFFIVDVLTPGQTLTQNLMMITELGNGEYQISFDTSFLTGLIGCELRIYANWTDGQLPLYENRTLAVTVYTRYRQTSVIWDPLPTTPFGDDVNLTFSYIDVLTSLNIPDNAQLTYQIQEGGLVLSSVYLAGSQEFVLALDTTWWNNVGTYTFHLDVIWAGSPFYQNRTSIPISITIRNRFTNLDHGPYTSIEYGNDLVIVFTYRDLDDQSLLNTGILALDASLSGSYNVVNHGDGTFTVTLDTSALPSIGIFTVNATITYTGTNFCFDANDFFYLTLIERRTQLTSDVPSLAIFLEEAVVYVTYFDDSTLAGILGATITASCPNATLQLGVNYWVDSLPAGEYRVRISTLALGNFGQYTITISATRPGSPFYQGRTLDVSIDVVRRYATISVTRSPLTTPFLSNVEFQVSAVDDVNSTRIPLTKSVLTLTHGGGTIILDSEYTLTGVGGFYWITMNSTLLTSTLIDAYPITIQFHWGDVAPYYENSTTSTQVTIANRFTQASVLSTPPAYYFFNISALIDFSDYLTGNGIPGADVTIASVNSSSFTEWIIDNGDGTYQVLVDTTSLSGLGRYFFSVNLTWYGSPYYTNVTNLGFSAVVNSVSTTLSFTLPQGVTYYLGDDITANITYTAIEFGVGIAGADIWSDWNATYPTIATINEIDLGVYEMIIQTSGMDAGLFSFSLNATKFLHQNQSILADILLAAVPVQIELVFNPTSPFWGDSIDFTANVTDARTGAAIVGAYVNLTISSIDVDMTPGAPGIYTATIQSWQIIAGEHTVTVRSVLLNFESRQRDFQIRIDKIASKIAGALDPLTTVNGLTVSIDVDYLINSNSSPIENGIVTYSWIGGSGIFTWSVGDGQYIVDFIVAGVPVGSHQILIQATSDNYKSVSMQLTLEITELTSNLVAVSDFVITVNYRDLANITVYLNNTDLNTPVSGAFVHYGVGPLVGNLSELATSGYYSGLVNTSELGVQEWQIFINSETPGYTPSQIQFTLNVEVVDTEVVILTSATLNGYYGEEVTFLLFFNDTHANEGISGAITNYTLEQFRGSLVDLGNGTYSLTLNTSLVLAGSVPHDVSVSFRKDNYRFASSLVKMRVDPIRTEIIGDTTAEFPVYDDYTTLFGFWDDLHGTWITDGSATATSDFGTVQLTNLNNGSYAFGPAEANLSTPLQDNPTPYSIRITITRGNYSIAEIEFFLTIREIATGFVSTDLPTPIYVGRLFLLNITFLDIDHSITITDAEILVVTTSSLATSDLIREEDYDIDHGNGTYTLAFRAPDLAYYNLRIIFSKVDYQSVEAEFDIYTDLTPEQEALVFGFQWGTLGLLGVAALGALYFRVLSVPRLLRIIRRMISALSKGKIPNPADVPARRMMLLAMMNEDLKEVGIQKTIEDVSLSTVDVTVMDVEDLLEDLATVVGLTPDDIETLRQDLDKMRPSERAGFINEVLKQERSRRARELAEAERVAEEGVPTEEIEEHLTEEELVHLKERLIGMGIEETEADLMIEQAKNLSKAEIDALLEEIGGIEE